MTQDEIDTMWQKAMQESIKDGEMFTRYHFAKLVADKATEEANARANASWTLMCKKMVAIEREALAQPERTWIGLMDAEKITLAKHFRAADIDVFDVMEEIETELKQKNGYAEEKNT